MLLWMHGWHGNVKSGHKDNVKSTADERFFRISPEMRGRGDSNGIPDANGWELQDAVDALSAGRTLYSQSVSDVAPSLQGGSGGGGNVLGILGKFPDLFAGAVCECGVSDYALWYANDSVGEFRDEMEDAGWIGGNPHTNPEAYLSRGGRTTAQNLLTPLLLLHGIADLRVPFAQAEAYLDAICRHGKEELVKLLSFPGVGVPDHFGGMTAEMSALRQVRTKEHLHRHSQPPEIPSSGTFIVAGYLRSRPFEVCLESVDQVALLQYDLAAERFSLQAPSCTAARVRMRGSKDWAAVSCRKISLDDFCTAAGIQNPRQIDIQPLKKAEDRSCIRPLFGSAGGCGTSRKF
jgi:pimeloyl-ACP methyl ester carboxylesterase